MFREVAKLRDYFKRDFTRGVDDLLVSVVEHIACFAFRHLPPGFLANQGYKNSGQNALDNSITF